MGQDRKSHEQLLAMSLRELLGIAPTGWNPRLPVALVAPGGNL
jgi:hypothetical protein